ncbi:MAG: DUF177 domain-containing protein [Desulfobacteraceae bacterium]|nr:MAG: DUF177 domain-containing protein [Desulfobacteraceae bacterium]
MIQIGEADFISPIVISAEVTKEGDFIRVEGTVSTSIRLPCGRCLTVFEAKISDEISLIFSRGLPVGETSDAEEKEPTADEIGLIRFQGEHIDLREAIQEQVVMMLPQKPLCSQSCRGLCPRCGADLNKENCDCKEPVLDDRLAILKSLKIKGNKD